MNTFPTLNRAIGWALFAIALYVYTRTLEPTASFWDCSEYIAAAYKLEVTHPPGAPLVLLVGRLFSFLAGHNLTRVAFWVNMSSAVASSATVMVVFWIISLLARKAIGKPTHTLQKQEAYQVWSAGIIGALSLTFCSTFWSNATETETYALSTLLMSLTIWSMLNWDHLPASPQSQRWILLVAYLLGLSLGLRMFSLLTLPALSLLYYFKKYPTVTLKGIIIALMGGVLLLSFLYGGIILSAPNLAMSLELFCVNTLGLPCRTGVIVLAIAICIPLVYGVWYTARQNQFSKHGVLLALVFILIGYSSYMLVPIRAKANPPINEGDPSNIISFTDYLKREQYGHRPLLYGPHFAAQVIGATRTTPIYRRKAGKYEIIGHKHQPVFRPDSYVWFPRTWSQQSAVHVQAYQSILGLKSWQKPDFLDQLYFLFIYQLPYCYFRYFFWNFAGRTSDLQGAPWIRPWEVLQTLPVALGNLPGRCNYFCLPLLLGLLGMAFQYRHDKRSLAMTLGLFLMLGVALLTFLNPPPVEPRERDYIYVGSFIIFTIWIGLGTLAISGAYYRIIKKYKLATLLGFMTCLAVPSVMALQGWSMHDRSKRYFAVETAKNLLASCAPQAILFTAGDNDTFPLWYVQEVEKFRTDVRVIVLSYANAGWYIQQLARKINDSPPLPLSLTAADYAQYGLNDFLPYIPQPTVESPLNVVPYLELIRSQHPALQIHNPFGETSNSLPCQELTLSIIPANMQDIVPPAYAHLVPQRLHWRVKGKGLDKRDLLLLDLIATNEWQRPIYFNHSSIHSLNLDLQANVVTEGLALRLLPIENSQHHELVNIPVMYENLMHHFHWKGLDQPGVYYDDNYRLVFIRNHRMAFCSLAKALCKAGEIQKAEAVLLRSLAILPDTTVPYDVANVYMLHLLFGVGNHEVALSMITLLGERAQAILAYEATKQLPFERVIQEQLAILYEISKSLHKAGYVDQAAFYQSLLQQYENQLIPPNRNQPLIGP